MSEKRMFALTMIDSDAFLELGRGARLLYYDLGMRADDEGFVNSPRKIMRMTGATDADLDELAERRFIIAFDTGVIVIKHWKINNSIRKDTFHPTKYVKEKELLSCNEFGTYSLRTRNEPVTNPSRRIDKIRLDKNIYNTTRPTVDEVAAYVAEKGYHFDAEAFVAFYESKGWKIGKEPMKNWKACCITWEKRQQPQKKDHGFEERKGQNLDAGVMDEFNKLMGD